MRLSKKKTRASDLRAELGDLHPQLAAARKWDEAEDVKEPVDWKKILLLAGLGTLSWISTYTGMLELIEANLGGVSLTYRIAIGFSVAMLMLMIIWLLDQLFARQPFVTRALFVTGYILLTTISVGFGFGFYWKFLESRSEASRSAVSAVSQVQTSLNMAQTRLEQLQTTLDQLTTISAEKAVAEREKGNSCPNSRPGDGPRRRLRDADASQFAFASTFVKERVGTVRNDVSDLEVNLKKIVSRDESTFSELTGDRNEFLRSLSRNLEQVVTRFNAFRSDPQLQQFRVSFADRAAKTVFPDDKGGQFTCPDPQLQLALRGVVLAIDQLPELDKPTVAAVEGSEAIIEAFRRLTATMFGVLQLKMPPTPDELRQQQQRAVQSAENIDVYRATQDLQAGLGKRDYIPLMIALFVDFCLLLVSVSRPMNRFQALLPKMKEARDGPVIDILSSFQLKPGIFRHVVFDFAGSYYVAVPLSAPFGHPRYDELQEQSDLLANMFASLESKGIFKRVVWADINPPLSWLVWTNLRTAKRRLRKQGSDYAESEAFRIYRFNDEAWSEMILGAVMGQARQAELDEAAKRRRAEQLRAELEPQIIEEIREDVRDELEPQIRQEERELARRDIDRKAKADARKKKGRRSFFDFGRPVQEPANEDEPRQADAAIAEATRAVYPGISGGEAGDLARTVRELVDELRSGRTGQAAASVPHGQVSSEQDIVTSGATSATATTGTTIPSHQTGRRSPGYASGSANAVDLDTSLDVGLDHDIDFPSIVRTPGPTGIDGAVRGASGVTDGTLPGRIVPPASRADSPDARNGSAGQHAKPGLVISLADAARSGGTNGSTNFDSETRGSRIREQMASDVSKVTEALRLAADAGKRLGDRPAENANGSGGAKEDKSGAEVNGKASPPPEVAAFLRIARERSAVGSAAAQAGKAAVHAAQTTAPAMPEDDKPEHGDPLPAKRERHVNGHAKPADADMPFEPVLPEATPRKLEGTNGTAAPAARNATATSTAGKAATASAPSAGNPPDTKATGTALVVREQNAAESGDALWGEPDIDIDAITRRFGRQDNRQRTG